MPHSSPPSILDLPPIWLELDVRQAFGLAYALDLFLRRVGGPTSGIQEELAGLAVYLREHLPAQCRKLIGAPTRPIITEDDFR